MNKRMNKPIVDEWMFAFFLNQINKNNENQYPDFGDYIK